jgi:hypothetical protein
MELLGELEAGPQGFEVTLGEGGLPDAQVLSQKAFVQGEHGGTSVHAGELLWGIGYRSKKDYG